MKQQDLQRKVHGKEMMSVEYKYIGLWAALTDWFIRCCLWWSHCAIYLWKWFGMRQNGYCWSRWSRPMRKKCNILWFVWSIALKVYNRHNSLTSRYWFYLRLRICFILLLSWLLLIFAFHLLFVSADFLRILTSECVADHERTPKYLTYIIYGIVSEAENSS